MDLESRWLMGTSKLSTVLGTLLGRPVKPGDDGGVGANGARLLALQLPFLSVSESMGNHDSQIVDAGSVN